MNRRSSTEWEALVEQHRKSNMSQKAFCEQQDIAYASFCYWSQKIRRRERGEDVLSIVELSMPATESTDIDFLHTRIQTDGISIFLEDGDGLLQITGTIRIEQLRAIILACHHGQDRQYV